MIRITSLRYSHCVVQTNRDGHSILILRPNVGIPMFVSIQFSYLMGNVIILKFNETRFMQLNVSLLIIKQIIYFTLHDELKQPVPRTKYVTQVFNTIHEIKSHDNTQGTISVVNMCPADAKHSTVTPHLKRLQVLFGLLL